MPDADMLICISNVLETPVSTLLGDSLKETKTDEIKNIAEQLQAINLKLAQRKENMRKMLHWAFIAVSVLVAVGFAGIAAFKSPYLLWDYTDPQIAAAGVILHGIEWVFVRIAPIIFVGTMIGVLMTRKIRRNKK